MLIKKTLLFFFFLRQLKAFNQIQKKQITVKLKYQERNHQKNYVTKFEII